MIRAGLRSPLLRTIVDVAVRTPDAARERTLWGEFFEPFDVPHIGASVLDAAGMLTQGLSAVGAQALAFNGMGAVVGMTPAAEAVLTSGRWFSLRRGRVRCPRDHETSAVEAAVARTPRTRTQGEFRLHRPGRTLTVRTFPLAATAGLVFNARALAVIEETMTASALTVAEAEVFDLLVQGVRTAEIAARREVSAGAVHAQTKAIYLKLGVHSQVELMRRWPAPR